MGRKPLRNENPAALADGSVKFQIQDEKDQGNLSHHNQRGTMTEFGELVTRLMRERYVEGPEQLSAIMCAWGYEVPTEEIVSYIEGTAPVGPAFPTFLAVVLGLSDFEEEEVIKVVYRGQGEWSPTRSELRA